MHTYKSRRIAPEYLPRGERDTVERSAFWQICEAHAKLDAETTVFSDTSASFIVNVSPS